MYSQVAMIRRAIETEVDTKGNGGPGWILRAAVKAYLLKLSLDIRGPHAAMDRTLFAGLLFSFSKIFCDWALVAELMVESQSRVRSTRRL